MVKRVQCPQPAGHILQPLQLHAALGERGRGGGQFQNQAVQQQVAPLRRGFLLGVVQRLQVGRGDCRALQYLQFGDVAVHAQQARLASGVGGLRGGPVGQRGDGRRGLQCGCQGALAVAQGCLLLRGRKEGEGTGQHRLCVSTGVTVGQCP